MYQLPNGRQIIFVIYQYQIIGSHGTGPMESKYSARKKHQVNQRNQTLQEWVQKNNSRVKSSHRYDLVTEEGNLGGNTRAGEGVLQDNATIIGYVFQTLSLGLSFMANWPHFSLRSGYGPVV